jgi:Tol biopolymer transport system component
MFHVRGSKGGTYILKGGKLARTDPKVDGMPGSATYPAWHPGGRYIAFSSNQVRQSFYSQPERSIEVFDLVSSLILFDAESNEIMLISDDDTTKYMSTFPSWSPDGRYLYYCRALQVINPDNPELEQIKNTRYNLVRREFFADSVSFGPPEVILNAADSGKSASFPRISPDGSLLLYTLADYGTFPIWHREADLYIMDLSNGSSEVMNINSDETESYHTWSSNGRWIVFSSKRADGRSARPHFAYVDRNGKTGREFVLPQKDPGKYDLMLESFNIPEFVNGKINLDPRDFARAAKAEPLKAKPSQRGPGENKEKIRDIPLKANEKAIH